MHNIFVACAEDRLDTIKDAIFDTLPLLHLLLEEVDEEENFLGLWCVFIFVNQLDGLVHTTLPHHIVLSEGVLEHHRCDVNL